MSKTLHRIYLASMVLTVVAVAIYLLYLGLPYYLTSIEERFYHQDHKMLKPSGSLGHGFGIFGTLLIIIGVFGYQARKYWKVLSRWGILKHWLEFHIFLCTLGPLLVLFHTSFKFGGLVSISFWSMVAVVASGVVGRFIYLQIPRTIHGRELSLSEIRELKFDLSQKIKQELGEEIAEEIASITDKISQKNNIITQWFEQKILKRKLKKYLKKVKIDLSKISSIINLIGQEFQMNRRIERLQLMQRLFRYWHVIHLPFAIIMLVIMLIHVGVTIAFGYKWIL